MPAIANSHALPTMADDESSSFPPNPDVYLRLGFIRNPDGSFTRPEMPPELTTPTPISSFINTPVVAKDITINPSNNLLIRIFIPREVFESSHETPHPKLPLILYFVGGGFVYRQANLSMHGDFYKKITVDTRSVFISISYRLAPEYTLPAPYDDAMEVLDWIKNTADDWISNFADTSNTWLVGASAGANIVYRVGLQVAASVEQHLNKPLKIKGLILSQPYFGGIKRTESEIRYGDDEIAALWITDIMWDLALPVGADRDHEYCNPVTGFKLKPDQFDGIKALGWKILIMTQERDPLSDRGIELYKMLKEKGVDVVGKFEEGGSHANNSPQIYKAIVDFVTSSSMAA